MLAAHMDTVGVDGYPDAFDPVVRGGRVHGRGSCDMKAAFACYLETVRILMSSGVRLGGDLILAGLCDEEHVMIGSRDLGKRGPRADYGIIGEPTGLAICPNHKGQLCLRISTFGRSTHSSSPEKGVNAVEMMGAVIGAFAGHNAELRRTVPKHPVCGAGRFSMNVIRGGHVVSAVPDLCELDIDRRYLPGESAETIIAGYRERLDMLARTTRNLTYGMSEPVLDVKPLDVPHDSPLVRAIGDAVRNVGGDEPRITVFPGATDAPNLGFPCVICGPGHLEQAHSTEEFVEIRQMADAVMIYAETLVRLAGELGRPVQQGDRA